MYKRVVAKVGTNVLSKDDGSIDAGVVEHLAEQISLLKKKGVEVVLVTSGAVGVGRTLFRQKKRVDTVAEKQVFAAVGQIRLMSMYADLFAHEGYLSAQVLATKEDFRDRQHYENMRQCMENLLRDNVIPVVNENDVVAVAELLFTDNDELAGLIASQINADALLILTSVDGIVAGDVHDPASAVIREVNFSDIGALEKYVTSEKSEFGRGGMLTKFAVAKKLALQGIATHIVNGKKRDTLVGAAEERPIGTKFMPQKKLSSVKRRIAHSEGLAKGTVHVNDCTEEMLSSKKIMSLLPVGITKVEGVFRKGDIIEIRGKARKLGFGAAQYDSEKATELAGKKGGRAIVHYDYLFIE